MSTFDVPNFLIKTVAVNVAVGSPAVATISTISTWVPPFVATTELDQSELEASVLDHLGVASKVTALPAPLVWVKE